MDKEGIEKYIEKQQKISDRNYMNYQYSGLSRYMRAHDAAEFNIELARRALSAADDHAAAGRYKADMCQAISKAVHIKHSNEDPDQLINDLCSMAALYGVRNPYIG